MNKPVCLVTAPVATRSGYGAHARDIARALINLDKYGNTSAASIPLAFSEADRMGKFKQGDIIVLAGFGAGFTWGVNVIKWHKGD